MAIHFKSRRGRTASLMFIAPRSKPARLFACVKESSHYFLLTGHRFVYPYLRNKPNRAKGTITLRNAPLKSQRRASVPAPDPHRNVIAQRWQRPRIQTQSRRSRRAATSLHITITRLSASTLPTIEATDHDRLSSTSAITGRRRESSNYKKT